MVSFYQDVDDWIIPLDIVRSFLERRQGIHQLHKYSKNVGLGHTPLPSPMVYGHLSPPCSTVSTAWQMSSSELLATTQSLNTNRVMEIIADPTDPEVPGRSRSRVSAWGL
jgi:hypothetical protein